MIVFNCFLRMIRRNCGMMILYFSIFVTICISVQLMTEGKGMANFEEERLNIAVIDQDGEEWPKNCAHIWGGATIW